MWRSQNDMFKQKCFWTKIVLSDPREIRTVKKADTRNMKKVQFFTFINNLLNRFKNFQLTSSFFFGKSFFLILFENYSEITIRFDYVGKRIFWRKKTHLSKTLNFVEKKYFFAIKKWDCVNEYLEIWKKIWPTAGFEPIISAFLTAVTHHTYVLYKTPTVLQTIMRVMGKIRKRKKNFDYWIEYFPVDNLSWQKVIILPRARKVK